VIRCQYCGDGGLANLGECLELEPCFSRVVAGIDEVDLPGPTKRRDGVGCVGNSTFPDLDDAATDAVENLAEEIEFRREVSVEDRLTHTGSVGDRGYAGGPEVGGSKHLGRRRHQRSPPISCV